jgi:hypothetical protein
MVAPDGDHPSETTPHTLPLARLLRIGIRCTIHAQKPQLEQIIGHCPKNQAKPIHKVAQFFIFFFYILKIKFYIKNRLVLRFSHISVKSVVRCKRFLNP